MTLIDQLSAQVPEGMSPHEWRARLELAACYRIFDRFGWSEVIFNHISLRLEDDGDVPTYLINPYGLLYGEITAHNLLKIDAAGEKRAPSPYPVNRAGFIIHSAVHTARGDAHCVVHTHTDTGMAVACKALGLRHDNFYAASLQGKVAYHAFEGITTDLDEQERIVQSLGEKRYLILRNHGLLAVGAHVPDALMSYWILQRACDVQARADAMQGANQQVPDTVLARIPEQSKPMHVGTARRGQMFFDALLRKLGLGAEDLRGTP